MNRLELKVILNAVDRITAPLKKMRDAGGLTAKGLKETQDRVKQLNKTAGQIDGYRKVSRQLGANSAELVKAQREVTRLAQEMKASSAPSKELTRSYEQARAATVRLVTQNKNLTISQQRQRNALKDAGINTRNLANHQRQLARDLTSANRHLDLQKQKLQQVARQQQAAARAKQSYDKALSVRGQLASTGAVMMGSGIAAGYAGSRFLQPGIGFGEQMSELQAIARLDKNSNDFQMLRKQARDLGASTAFSGSEVGAAQTFLARAGFTPDAIHASMQDVLNLALANKTDLATTADIASNIGGVFKIDPAVEGNMRRIADVLSGTAARANVDLQMLGETMKYLGGVEELGMSLEQAAAMAGIMGNIGIQSSMAGTTTRGMVNRLTKPAAEARAAMEELGLAVSDAQGNMRQLPDILKDINEATKHMGSVDRKEIMQTIFGAEAGSGAAELVAAMENGQLTTLLSELENLKINPGESQKMADIMADNIGGDLKGLRSAWEEIGIAVTDVNDGAIRDLVKSITGVIRAVVKWIQANPELVAKLSKVATIVTGLAIAGGSLTLALAGILGPLAMLRYGATLLGIKTLPTVIGMIKMLTLGVFNLGAALLMTPIGWIILGITALIAAGYFLVKHWDTVKAWIGDFWEGIKAFTANAVGAVVQWFADLWQGAGDLCQAGIAFIKELFSGIANFIGNVLGGIWDAMKTVFGWTPLGLIVNNWDQISAYFSGLPARFTEFGSNLMSGLVEGITGKLSAVKDAVTGAASSAIGWFKDVLGIKSPSTVFAAAGDDTMAGLTLGIQRSQSEPLNQVNQLSKQLTAASFVLGISALPAVAEPIKTENYSAQRVISEQLQPANIPALQDGQRTIIELVNPAQLAPVPNAQRTITEQLQPVNIPALQDGQRTITELVSPAQLTPMLDAKRVIAEELRATKLNAIPDETRTIREQFVPGALANQQQAIKPVNSPFTAAADKQPTKAPQTIQVDASINAPITIYPQPGMDANDIARQIAAELDKRERAQKSRLRSALRDLE